MTETDPTDRDWFTFQASVLNVVDGDTLDMRVDLGFRTVKDVRVRLSGVDTAEIYGVDEDSPEHERGMKQTRFVKDWLQEHRTVRVTRHWPFVLDTETDTGKYGRWPGRVIAKDDGSVLNEELIDQWPSVESTYE